MKNNFILMTCGLLLAFALGQSAHAQTPDGETPAEEVVCDSLRADGVTKGLYGLCVAFCEAQDHAAVSGSITEEELEALADQAPSGRILANYNKKKTETDPPMPCIKIEEPCPCWTSEEVADIDGVMADFTTADRFACQSDDPSQAYVIEQRFNRLRAYSLIAVYDAPGTQFCQYVQQFNPGIESTFLSVSEGTLTLGELQSCKDSMASAIEAAQALGCTEDP